jgi:hypothetical protein
MMALVQIKELLPLMIINCNGAVDKFNNFNYLIST